MPASPQAPTPPKVAVLPWAWIGGTDTAVKTGKDTINALFNGVNFEIVPEARTKTAWQDGMNMSAMKERLEEKDSDPSLPTPKELLKLGKMMDVDFVCAGFARWHTKSVWIALGPKTKADCTVTMEIVDVKKEEVALDSKAVKSDDTRKESGLETAGALLLTAGITAFSGGPKTPHQQKSVSNAIALSMEPWLKTRAAAGRKIGG